jgi:crossover junction endodeoxyribonuclease RuvC
MRILGVDPGTKIVGYGVLDVNGNLLEPVASGVIRTSRTGDLSERLNEIWDGIREVIRKTQPDVAAVEAVFHGRNTSSLIKIGEARGVILLAAASAGIPAQSYSPAEVKKAVTGRGNARKEQVRHMVGVICGRSIAAETDDETDALAVAICRAHRARIPGRV